MRTLRGHAGSLVRGTAATYRRGRLLVGSRPPPPAAVDVGDIQNRVRRLLGATIVDFWFPPGTGDLRGGYGAQLDRAGRSLGPPVLHAVSVSRALWLASTLAGTEWARPAMAGVAQVGFDILRSRLWDPVRGGMMTIGGEPLPHATDKHFYGQLMALDALVAFVALSDSDDARLLAADVLDVVDRRFHDARGGYIEGFAGDWSALPMGRGLVVPDPTIKTTSTHVNATYVFGRVHTAGIANVAGHISELIDIIEKRTRLASSEQMGEVFSRDWTVRGRQSVSFGHDLERIWMVRSANEAAGLDLEPDPMGRVELFADTVRFARDPSRGGFYFSGPVGRAATRLEKHWWVQAEALVACTEMYEMTGDEVYLRYLEETLRWIEGRQADWVHGEWHERIDAAGRPRGRKAWDWKAGYHTARSLLAVLDWVARARRQDPGSA